MLKKINWANRITLFRMLIAVVYFILLGVLEEREVKQAKTLFDLCFLLFCISVISDILDGIIARTMNMETDFGRVADPFVDKVLVCGSFVFFLRFDSIAVLLPPWMVVVIIAREFIVHGLRSLVEGKGISFGSTHWGKHKMFFQSAAIIGCLIYLGHLKEVAWAKAIVQSLIILSFISTIFSGLTYIYDVNKILLQKTKESNKL